jgi:hypothetical protein
MKMAIPQPTTALLKEYLQEMGAISSEKISQTPRRLPIFDDDTKVEAFLRC